MTGVESLYPFPYADKIDLAAVLAQVSASTVAKAREITELRRRVLAEQGERLSRCAAEMAVRFAAGGRLLSFGNGGSSTDPRRSPPCSCPPATATGRCRRCA